MPGQDFIVVPDVAPLTLALEPAQNAVYSLLLLTRTKDMPGLGNWVVRTVDTLTPEERKQHEFVIIGFYNAILPQQSWSSFPAYVDHLATRDPNVLRDRLLAAYARVPLLAEGKDQGCYDEPEPIDLEVILKDVDSYLDYLRARFDEKSLFDVELEARAFSYIVDPPAMQELIVSHLRMMWHEYLAPEWERVEPMLRDSVNAFQQVDFGDMTQLEAAKLITGQELGDEKWAKVFEKAEQVIFVPTAHVGPYLGKILVEKTLWILFGARLPEGVQFHAPDLSRAEIVVRLSALADDNRLRILKLVSENGELPSQSIMASLGFSQSTTSRHLTQLSAT
jgi:hypothetical protein